MQRHTKVNCFTVNKHLTPDLEVVWLKSPGTSLQDPQSMAEEYNLDTWDQSADIRDRTSDVSVDITVKTHLNGHLLG